MNRFLDLSTLMARLLLAVLAAATFALLGLWLREGNALGFAATLVSVSVTWFCMSALRGRRVGPPTAAAARLQPVVDALAEYPGGRIVAEPGFKRGVTALCIGIAVASAEHLLGTWLLSGTGLPPLWRGLIALAIILVPVYVLMEWLVSKQTYTGTRFASKMLDAVWKVIHPDSTTTPWADTSVRARVIGFGLARTVFTLGARIVAQVLIPMAFTSWVSIGFVVALIVTSIAGWPLIAAAARALRKTAPATAEKASNEGGETA
ncbi:hypothetical protein [Brachybacterium saurashtrense]|uniref:DUF3159 domain-containing protein n=1 Tax=Brachybacterium saurashtrense TaxID=556288 RepID=A0A345YPU3_9MICO|nr:hypothetical protein [Brachybacterium saurashtrense]AXK45945.1 hypothetical protein DWV08_10230 [Brachybacterium saurashtrense]RRR23683.1 hypothetical protein DXU92_01980 [Brachybacterium saurashtrense]